MCRRRDDIAAMRFDSQARAANRGGVGAGAGAGGADGGDDEAAALMGIAGPRDDASGGAGGGGGSAGAGIVTGPSNTTMLPFRVEDLLALELTRLHYAVADLIRVRIQKLQFFRAAIVANPQRYDGILSPNELVLVHGLHAMFEAAMLAGGLGQLPEELRSDPAAAAGQQPDLAQYVLVIAIRDCEIQLPHVDVANLLRQGESMICPYMSVRRHLIDGLVRLL